MKVTKNDRKVMRQAAAALSSYARLIFESEVERSPHSVGRVTNQLLAEEIREYRALATRLRKMAGRRK